ncbi:MAG: hypothetical protein KGO79_00425 [Betaproteobacteria bacterium]|nr:hypothetical protein [Betaproteobacteria bacterium]
MFGIPGFSGLRQLMRRALRAPCRLCGNYGQGAELCTRCTHRITVTPWGVSTLSVEGGRIPILWRELYGGPLTELIYQSKYHGVWPIALLLGQQLGSLPRPWMGPPPVIIPIPLSRRRLARRGYNQSSLIARVAAQHWGIPMRDRWLEKIRNTPRQAALGRASRRENLSDSFRARQIVAHQRVILLDDIMTSGSTLREAIRAIRHCGGEVIGAAVIARVGAPSPGRAPQGRRC